ncbi:hypothetical protein SDRG_14917 [Saprolegnia diclina VS20]|uniref:Uncharacterized protein n=1 Tax=Saprolegnia diclina (strain VS20) TaxID=1156394 RepID=T0PYH9_SAPDV|nr:hypothetical protein SDRG_14917 [Saprolegnia diclina VS20]EQC27296.1 hypothetical protein SDRG_14917 [Saprolegnia diclina VS20]|eukprot:XP_008619299.1 hypothetical protein SDRG_14917 [Saprolegnia diclina VS20]
MVHNQDMPVANVLCARRELSQNAALLLENLRGSKGMCHVTSPRAFAHLEFNAKKASQVAEMHGKISYENALLMEKMAHIMVPSAKSLKSATAFAPGTCIDANMLPKIDNHNKYTLVSGYERNRVRQNARIAKENELYRKRILAQKPTYSVQAFEASNAAKNVHLQRIHKQLITSSPTPTQLKADAVREANEVKRAALRTHIYRPHRVDTTSLETLDPFVRNQTCICIDNFEPRPPITSGNQAPRRPPGRQPARPSRPEPPTFFLARQSSQPEDSELELILTENESIPVLSSPRPSPAPVSPQTSVADDLSPLETLSSMTLSDRDYLHADFSLESN